MKTLYVFWTKEEYDAASQGPVVDWEQADTVVVTTTDEEDEVLNNAYRVFFGSGSVECSRCGEIVYGARCDCQE